MTHEPLPPAVHKLLHKKQHAALFATMFSSSHHLNIGGEEHKEEPEDERAAHLAQVRADGAAKIKAQQDNLNALEAKLAASKSKRKLEPLAPASDTKSEPVAPKQETAPKPAAESHEPAPAPASASAKYETREKTKEERMLERDENLKRKKAALAK